MSRKAICANCGDPMSRNELGLWRHFDGYLECFLLARLTFVEDYE